MWVGNKLCIGTGQPASLRTLPTVPTILHTLSVLYRQGASQSATAFLELLGAVSEKKSYLKDAYNEHQFLNSH
jgi:hypothetical protein